MRSRDVGEDDAKSLDDGDAYYADDDDHYEYDDYDDDVDTRKSRPGSRSYHQEPDHYHEHGDDQLQYYYQPSYLKTKKRKKKVYVPVFVPEKEKKKSELGFSRDYTVLISETVKQP